MPRDDKEEGANGSNYQNPFDDKLKRRSFIMKIYTLVFVCLSVTVVHIALVLNYPEIRNFLAKHYYIIWIAFGAYFITGIIYSCFDYVLRDRKIGPIVLIILVESLSIICAERTMFYETYIILLAAIGISVLTLIITIVAIFIPFDMTKYGFILCVLGGLLMSFMIICFIVGYFVYIPMLEHIYAFATVFVYSIYMLYDTQIIIGGKSLQFTEKDYIDGIISLYVDIITIYRAILKIFRYFYE